MANRIESWRIPDLEATKSVLANDIYRSKFAADKNPNLAVIAALRKAGVEVFVCGQALAYKGPKEELAMSRSTSGPALSLLVPLPSDLARAIDTLAKQRGQDRVQFIVSFLQEQLRRCAPSFEEIMAPIAGDFAESGMSEENLDALVEQERQAIWNEKHP